MVLVLPGLVLWSCSLGPGPCQSSAKGFFKKGFGRGDGPVEGITGGLTRTPFHALSVCVEKERALLHEASVWKGSA